MLGHRQLLLGLSAVILVAAAATAYAATQPEIMSRAQWKAKAADTKLMKKQTPREIIVHHTSERQQPKISLERKLQGLQGFSFRPGQVGSNKKPAWGDVPYHFYIGESGGIAEGRDISYAGDTNTKYNTSNRIQIVVEGNFENEQPNAKQLEALTALIVWLAAKYKIPPDKITGHNDQAPTACPGKHLKAHLPALRAKVSGK